MTDTIKPATLDERILVAERDLATLNEARDAAGAAFAASIDDPTLATKLDEADHAVAEARRHLDRLKIASEAAQTATQRAASEERKAELRARAGDVTEANAIIASSFAALEALIANAQPHIAALVQATHARTDALVTLATAANPKRGSSDVSVSFIGVHDAVKHALACAMTRVGFGTFGPHIGVALRGDEVTSEAVADLNDRAAKLAAKYAEAIR